VVILFPLCFVFCCSAFIWFFFFRKKRRVYVDENMPIFVKMTESEKIVTLVVRPSDRVERVKLMMERKEGVPIARQRMTFYGKLMENELTLFDYDVLEQSTLKLDIVDPSADSAMPRTET